VAAQHVEPVALGHAAEHAQDDVLAFALAHAHGAHAAQRLLFGELAHRARVVEDDLRVGVILDEAVAERGQLATHQLAVELVHLASEGLEVDAHAKWTRVTRTGARRRVRE
jgi:hypothetical protein